MSDDHWLLVNEQALARLDGTPSFELLRRRADGGFDHLAAHRRDLYHLHHGADGRVWKSTAGP